MYEKKKMGLTVAITACLIAIMLLQGCVTNTSTATPPLTIKAIEPKLKSVAGDTVTFIILIKNNQNTADNLILTVPVIPAGWRTTLSNDTPQLTAKGSRAVFVVIDTSAGAISGGHTIKVKAQSTQKPSVSAAVSLSVTLLKAGTRVGDGSNVKVDYVGYLGTYTVFDTSVKAVGSDLYIPKDTAFTSPTDNAYQPLAFTVGAGQMIPGFDAAVKGMYLGQTKTIKVEPKDGYGRFEAARIGLMEEFTMYTNLTADKFLSKYGEAAAPNKVVFDPYWKWKVQVVDVVGDTVCVLTMPDMNQTSQPYGWDSKVTIVDGTANGGAGRIQVKHYPTAGINVTYNGMKATVSSLTADSIELSYNTQSGNPLAVQNLYFIVRVVSIA